MQAAQELRFSGWQRCGVDDDAVVVVHSVRQLVNCLAGATSSSAFSRSDRGGHKSCSSTSSQSGGRAHGCCCTLLLLLSTAAATRCIPAPALLLRVGGEGGGAALSSRRTAPLHASLTQAGHGVGATHAPTKKTPSLTHGATCFAKVGVPSGKTARSGPPCRCSLASLSTRHKQAEEEGAHRDVRLHGCQPGLVWS